MPKHQPNPVLQHIRKVAADPPPELADRELLERFTLQNDEAAFAALVRRHGPMIFRLCRRVLHNDHDAEDAFQATFLVLSRKALRLRGSLGGWLYCVAYRVAQKARVAAARRAKHEGRAAARPVADPPAELTLRENARTPGPRVDPFAGQVSFPAGALLPGRPDEGRCRPAARLAAQHAQGPAGAGPGTASATPGRAGWRSGGAGGLPLLRTNGLVGHPVRPVGFDRPGREADRSGGRGRLRRLGQRSIINRRRAKSHVPNETARDRDPHHRVRAGGCGRADSIGGGRQAGRAARRSPSEAGSPRPEGHAARPARPRTGRRHRQAEAVQLPGEVSPRRRRCDAGRGPVVRQPHKRVNGKSGRRGLDWLVSVELFLGRKAVHLGDGSRAGPPELRLAVLDGYRRLGAA